jgi:toxin ParE1/3/4
MTAAVRLSETAIKDLAEIRNWIAELSDQSTALAYIDRVSAKVRTLADFPLRGRARPEVGRDIRSFAFERRLVIFYRIEGPDVWIERIVSGARDLEALM